MYLSSIKHANLSVAMDIFVISLIWKIKEKALIDTHCILKNVIMGIRSTQESYKMIFGYIYWLSRSYGKQQT